MPKIVSVGLNTALLQRLIFGSRSNFEASLGQPRANRVMLEPQATKRNLMIATVLKPSFAPVLKAAGQPHSVQGGRCAWCSQLFAELPMPAPGSRQDYKMR